MKIFKILIIIVALASFTTLSQASAQSYLGSNPPITVYGSSNCPWSAKMIQYLNQSGYRFEVVMIDQSKANYSRYINTVGKGKVPVVAVGEGSNGSHWRGYNTEVVTQMLSDYGYTR